MVPNAVRSKISKPMRPDDGRPCEANSSRSSSTRAAGTRTVRAAVVELYGTLAAFSCVTTALADSGSRSAKSSA